MAGLPDPKPTRTRGNRPRRVVDPDATRRVLRRLRACAACGRPACNTHHVLGKGQGGDDVEENLVPLCGSGSARCHGALHGTPYVDEDGRRWTAQDVRRGIGAHVRGRRPDVRVYLTGKLGADRARDHLDRLYPAAA